MLSAHYSERPGPNGLIRLILLSHIDGTAVHQQTFVYVDNLTSTYFFILY